MRKFNTDLFADSGRFFDNLELGSYLDANSGYAVMPEWAMDAVAFTSAPMDTASAGFTLDKMVESSSYHSPSLSEVTDRNDDLLALDDDSYGCCSCIGCSTVDTLSSIEGAGGMVEAPAAPASLTTLANYLEVGYWNDTRGGTTGSRYFNVSDSGTGANSGVIYYNVTGWSGSLVTEGGTSNTDSNGVSAARAAVIRAAIAVYENTLGINFVETTSDSGFVDIFFGDQGTGAVARSRMHGGTSATDGPIDFAVINIAPTWPANRILQTTFHEIGHVLGLGHQGDYNFSGSYASDALWENDSWQLSMMSYWSQTANTDVNADFARLQTPMSVDWLALDNIYSSQSYTGNTFGVSQAFTGNTVYGFNTNITAAVSSLFNDLANVADTRAFTIVDGGGVDTVDFSGFSDDQNIDLRESTSGSTTGRISDVGGVVGNMTIAVGTIIENVRSGSGDDTLWGNNSNNDFYGGGGDDTMYGGNGNDDFYYENGEDSGIDNLYGGAGTDRLIVEGAGTYDMQGLNVLSIEEIEFNADGTNVDKTIILSNKELDSAGEFATALLIDGNSATGSDDAIIINMDVGIPSLNSVDISGWTFTGWNAPSSGGSNVDTITINGDSDANTLTGSSTDDIINDSSGADTVNGGAGNDTLNVGTGADDINGDAGDDLFTIAFDTSTVSDLDGGTGIDTFSIANYGGDYSINLATGEWRRLSDNLLLATLSNIENVEGGDFSSADDVITGSAGANVINGNDGDDVIDAGAGSDTTNSGDGDDTLLERDTTADSHDGGAGTDLIDYNWGNWGSIVTFDMASGNYTVGATIIDTFVNFENLIFSGSAAAIGDANANVITGGTGANNIDGGSGDDTLNGLAGNDVLTGGSGVDTINAGDGDDTILFTSGHFWDNVDGGAGTDTIDASAIAINGTFDFAAGTISGYGGVLTLANVENFIGGDTTNDTIISDGSGSFMGGGGDDYIAAGLGSFETLDGGTGTDTLDTTSYTGNYVVNLATGATNFAPESFTNFENLISGAGNDTLTGTTGSNDIDGGAGNDTINGGGGADNIDGGDGDDTLIDANSGIGDVFQGGAGIDTLVADFTWNSSVIYDLDMGWMRFPGPAGSTYDTITGVENLTVGGAAAVNGDANANVITILDTGSLNDNTINGAAGDDVINAGIGNDTINGGIGNDTVYGGAGNDMISDGSGLSSGTDTIFGDAGDDTIFQTDGLVGDVLDGGAGIDTLDHSGLNVFGGTVVNLDTGEIYFTGNPTGPMDTAINFENFNGDNLDEMVFGTAGVNLINGNDGNDDIRAGDGNDTLNGGAGEDVIYGQGGDDIASGGTGDDSLVGGLGDDTLNGGADNDLLNGQAGDDILNGGDGNDDIFGASGNDTIDAGLGDDAVNAGGGDDTIDGGAGDDDLRGAVGFDTINGGDGNDIISGGNQNDTLNGDAGNDTLNGDAGNDIVNGGDNDDTLIGASGADTLNGDAGNDNLSGGAGGDDLFGGAGADMLNGGGGNDNMNGGAGADTFVFNQPVGVDRIEDFEDGIDLIDLSGFGLANVFADVSAVASQVGANVRLDFNPNNVIILENFDLADLDASDFIF